MGGRRAQETSRQIDAGYIPGLHGKAVSLPLS